MDMHVLQSDEQRMTALQRANELRLYRADLKRRVFDGSMEKGLALARRILLDPPEEVLEMKVLDLLRSVRGYSSQKAFKLMISVGISQAKTVTGMTARQRDGLVDELLRHEAHRRRYLEQRVRAKVARNAR